MYILLSYIFIACTRGQLYFCSYIFDYNMVAIHRYAKSAMCNCFYYHKKYNFVILQNVNRLI